MHIHLRSILFLAIALVAFPACDSNDDSDDAEFSIGGTYTASLDGSGFPAGKMARLPIPTTASGESFEFELFPFGTDFSSTGTGTYNHPTLTLDYDDFDAGFEVTATVSDDGDTITFNGGTFSDGTPYTGGEAIDPDLQPLDVVVFTR